MDQNIERFDVAIIGASISGNFLSYLLSKSNLTIAIIEEHNEIGLSFQCAGIFSKKLNQIIDLAPSGKFIKVISMILIIKVV